MSERGAPANRYFALDGGPEASERGNYLELEEVAPVEFVAGLSFKPVITDDVLVNFVHYEPHTVVPLHSHPESQITFVIDGEFEFDLGGDVRVMRRGMVAVIPPWVPHAARTRDGRCFQIDVFQPPRSALLDLIASEGGKERSREPPESVAGSGQ